jgi:hypothetical protein
MAFLRLLIRDMVTYCTRASVIVPLVSTGDCYEILHFPLWLLRALLMLPWVIALGRRFARRPAPVQQGGPFLPAPHAVP